MEKCTQIGNLLLGELESTLYKMIIPFVSDVLE